MMVRNAMAGYSFIAMVSASAFAAAPSGSMSRLGEARLQPAGEAGLRRAVPAAIVVGRYVAPDGTLKENVAITLADGKIKSVVPAAEFKGDENVLRFPGAVASPGLIDARSSLGAYGQTAESAFTIDPAVSAIDSVDPFHRDFRRALEAGITTVVIPPAPNNIVSGAAAVLKTCVANTGTESVTVLRDDGPLILSLGPSVWQYDREPTSRMGSLAILRRVIDEAAQGQAHPRIQQFFKGDLQGVVVCGEPADVSAAIRTLRPSGGSGQKAAPRARFAIAHDGNEHELAEELAGLDIPVILGPLDFSAPHRSLTWASALAAAKVPIAFSGNIPAGSPSAIRVSAALAVRHGLDPAVARQAMTTVPAEIAGVADRVGAIRGGLDADLIIFTDDPLRLDAAVVAVFVDGVRVYSYRN